MRALLRRVGLNVWPVRAAATPGVDLPFYSALTQENQDVVIEALIAEGRELC
jgi:hypothetical protein